jgi:hypothetical protein
MNATQAVNPQVEETNDEAARFFGLEIVQDVEESPEEDFEVWSEHWQAMRLFKACNAQLEIAVGGMGGVFHQAARSVNVQQELQWLGLPKADRIPTVVLYREIEREALRLLNQPLN